MAYTEEDIKSFIKSDERYSIEVENAVYNGKFINIDNENIIFESEGIMLFIDDNDYSKPKRISIKINNLSLVKKI